MLTGEGRVVLIDFGLAREYSVDETTPMTRMVTPGYAPPEQYALDARCGPPADVYGLAATLYWTLTSRGAGTGNRPPDRYTAHAAVPDHPIGVEAAVGRRARWSGTDPAHRPQTVEAFLARIGRPSPNGTSAPAAAIADRDAPGLEGTLPLASPPAPLPVPPSVAPGRRTALLPLFGSHSPSARSYDPSVVVAAVVVLPASCTAGDAVVYVRLRRSGDRLLWRHRTALLGYVPVRFIRNLGHVLMAGVPALLLGATVATALAIDSVTSTSTAADGCCA